MHHSRMHTCTYRFMVVHTHTMDLSQAQITRYKCVVPLMDQLFLIAVDSA